MTTFALHCPCCGTAVPVSREAAEAALKVAPEESRTQAIEARVAAWRTWCRESGRHITPDDRVRTDVAAELTGLDAGTLKNRRNLKQRPHFSYVGKLAMYTLYELADWITAPDS